MKKIAFLVFLCLFSSYIRTYAQQSVGIGTNTPNPRSVLQLVSPTQNQGFLLPKLTTTEVTNLGTTLVASDRGLIVYDSLLNQIQYWNGTIWLSLGVAGGGITSLNGLSTTAQTFAIGTLGTNFNINSVGTTHTFNFPNASAASRGLLTSTDLPVVGVITDHLYFCHQFFTKLYFW
jgi:hypothetical protein